MKLETGGSQDFLCHCFHRSPADLRAEIVRLNLKTVTEVYQKLLQGGACRSCAEDIQKLLDETWSRAQSARLPT